MKQMIIKIAKATKDNNLVTPCSSQFTSFPYSSRCTLDSEMLNLKVKMRIFQFILSLHRVVGIGWLKLLASFEKWVRSYFWGSKVYQNMWGDNDNMRKIYSKRTQQGDIWQISTQLCHVLLLLDCIDLACNELLNNSSTANFQSMFSRKSDKILKF